MKSSNNNRVMAAKLSSKSGPIDGQGGYQFIDILGPIIGQQNLRKNYVYFFSIFNRGV